MKKHWIAISIVLFLCIFSILFFYCIRPKEDKDFLIIQDVSRLIPVEVREIVHSKEEKQLINIIKEAKEKALKISIAGVKHSQGGHALYPDSVHLDMTGYNQILNIN